jgi:outer membrane lipoprotein-sorting protein
MHKMLIVLVSAALAGAAAGESRDAQSILKQVGQTYQNASSFQFAGTTSTVTKSSLATSESEVRFEVAFEKPGQMKVEFHYPDAGVWLRVLNGKTYSAYRSLTGQETHKAASAFDLDILLNSTVIPRFEKIADGVESAKLTGTEMIDVGGKPVQCEVVEVTYKGRAKFPGMRRLPTKYWIDPQHNLVLREMRSTESQGGHYQTINTRTTTFTMASLNQPIPSSVFEFSKP